MTFTLALMGIALHTLFWEKLPDWGTWFNSIIKHLPAPLAYLYEAWRCPFCFGFWCALALHAITDIFTINALSVMPEFLGSLGMPLAWLLDALATATLIMFGHLILCALAAPAIKGYQMKETFRQNMSAKGHD
ncbi:hypothetical protein [Thalassomonas sp. RHCl1]|uniref:hypothetical protein n=1 Tax=Thalassomonas sp. RHCl1 TaxID=2995320 RepID=UPI00248D37AA|nr:hypothetical protein [Thalassomonas sp. RHCl1]